MEILIQSLKLVLLHTCIENECAELSTIHSYVLYNYNVCTLHLIHHRPNNHDICVGLVHVNGYTGNFILHTWLCLEPHLAVCTSTIAEKCVVPHSNSRVCVCVSYKWTISHSNVPRFRSVGYKRQGSR